MTDEATVELWPVNIRTGLWCNTCQLPGVVAFNLATLGPDGVAVTDDAAELCTECPSSTEETP